VLFCSTNFLQTTLNFVFLLHFNQHQHRTGYYGYCQCLVPMTKRIHSHSEAVKLKTAATLPKISGVSMQSGTHGKI